MQTTAATDAHSQPVPGHPDTIVIGAGFSGLAAACFLAKAGLRVHVVERHDQPGGRARVWRSEGFRFDMGPSWYWMPDLFERFFAAFDREVPYGLTRLDPSYRIYWEGRDEWDIPAGLPALRELFDSREPGAGEAFDRFLDQTRYIYETAVSDYLLRPSLSLTEFFDVRLVAELFKLRMLRSMHGYAQSFFDDPRLVRLVEWPVLFLGASAKETSAMYSLMSYADMALGTWYPDGGMHSIIEGMVALAESLGVIFEYSAKVDAIELDGKRATGVRIGGEVRPARTVLAAADYHHVEQSLLPRRARQVSARSWSNKTMAPSSLLLYLGLDRRVDALEHHNLFFDRDLDRHMDAVYKHPRWPDDPLFYVCAPSRTDPGSAPEGCENVFVLVPLAAGLEDSDIERDRCATRVLERLEARTGVPIRDHIVVERRYAMRDFVSDYGAFRGNAYGMANTLRQTGPLKPPLRSRKVDGLYFAGQLTVPGPGMPPSLISGELAAGVLVDDLGQQ